MSMCYSTNSYWHLNKQLLNYVYSIFHLHRGFILNGNTEELLRNNDFTPKERRQFNNKRVRAEAEWNCTKCGPGGFQQQKHKYICCDK